MRSPGTGALSAYGYLDGDRAGGAAGLGLDLEAKLERDLSLFATGRAGWAYGNRGDGLEYEALAGIRWNW